MLTLAVLEPEDVRRVRAGLASVPFRDGKLTAGSRARAVKANQQAVPEDRTVQALGGFVRQALERHPLFAAYARPARWSKVIFSRYEAGDAYGLHTDDAFMTADGGGPLRTDLSFTLFLSELDAYEGGALSLEGVDGAREVRPPAGAAVIYPTGRPHQVTPVTAGERLAAVGWIQSRIRSGDQREVLFDLARLSACVPDGEPRLLLDKTVGALLRLWAEP